MLYFKFKTMLWCGTCRWLLLSAALLTMSGDQFCHGQLNLVRSSSAPPTPSQISTEPHRNSPLSASNSAVSRSASSPMPSSAGETSSNDPFLEAGEIKKTNFPGKTAVEVLSLRYHSVILSTLAPYLK